MLPFHSRCDLRCHYFGDCCFDANHLDAPVKALEYSCVKLNTASSPFGHAIIKTCPFGASIKAQRLCSDGAVGTWSPLGWPVSDARTKLR